MRQKIDRTGERAINTKGRLMKIVIYNNSQDMVVEFVEDGVRVNRVQYDSFKKGNVRHPKDKTKANYRVGETSINTQGRLMKIVEYNSSQDMVVEFGDGERVSGVAYRNFKRGNVRHPKDKDRTGETAHNTQGLLMKIVKYNSSQDMVVEFVEDGERVNRVQYTNFKKGNVRHPKDKAIANYRVGKTAINTQGLLMKIVEYNSAQDMVVEFEDGERVSRVTYQAFKRGNVCHLKDKATAENRVGETATATNGQTMTIVEYLNHKHIMVQFPEKDLPPIKATYRNFQLGQVKNPHFPMRGKGTYKTFKTEYAYTTPSGEVYFYCECQNCGWKKNLTAQELIAMKHECIR